MSAGYIYGLFDPRNGLDPHTCRYIGQTSTTIEARLHRHIGSARSDSKKHTHVSRWIVSLLNDGVRPVAMLFQETTLDMLDHAEREWIANTKWLGWDLTNHQSGGKNNMLLPGAKEKVGAAQRGLKRSEETRAKMRAAALGISPTPETRAKISATLTGRKLGPPSEETRRKIGDAQRGKKLSEEHVRLMTEQANERWANPEVHEVHSQLMSEIMNTPEMRQKVSDGRRAQVERKFAEALTNTTDDDPVPTRSTPLMRFLVSERSAWTCYVCDEKIDPHLTYINSDTGKPDPGYFHIIFAVLEKLGGPRTYGNAKAAHGSCAKKYTQQQLLEAGIHPLSAAGRAAKKARGDGCQ